MQLSIQKAIQFLISITALATLFHLFIIIKVIPYEITWGGRLKNDSEMYVFETVSIIINSLYIFILLQRGNLIRTVINNRTVTISLWIFFVIFSLNTLGNIFAKTTFEKFFTILTFINAILLWKIIRHKS